MKEEIKIPDDPNIHANYTYDHVAKEWKFMGYRCIKCEQPIKFAIDRHQNTCRKRGEKKYKVDPAPVYIFDMDGKPWKPLDFNQVDT